MEKYTVFVIQAYKLISPDGLLLDNVTLELIDTNEENAMTRAKELVKKDNYRLSQIIEKYVSLN